MNWVKDFFSWAVHRWHFWMVYVLMMVIISGQDLYEGIIYGEKYFLTGLFLGQFILNFIIYGVVYGVMKLRGKR